MSFISQLRPNGESNGRPLLFGALALGLTALLFLASGDDGQRGEPAGETAAAATETEGEGTTGWSNRTPRRRLTPPRSPELVSPTRLVVTLVALTLVLVPGLVLLRRYLKKMRVAPGGERVLELVDAMPLGAKRQVYVVAAYDRRLVIATTGDRVELLTELAGPPAAESAPSSGATAEPATFSRRIEPLIEMENEA